MLSKYVCVRERERERERPLYPCNISTKRYNKLVKDPTQPRTTLPKEATMFGCSDGAKW